MSTETDEPAERDPAIIAGLRDWIQTYQPDLVWLGFGGISYDLVPLKEQTGKPLVLETECVWSRFVLRELPFEADAERRQRIVREGQAKEAEERAGAPLVDITTAVSEVDADYFRACTLTPERVMLLANVIDVDAYQAPASAAVRLEQPALVFAGTLSHGTANVDATCWLVDEVLPIVWRTATRRARVRRGAQSGAGDPGATWPACARDGRGPVDRALHARERGCAGAAALGVGHALQDSRSIRVPDARSVHHPGRRGPRRPARTAPAASRRARSVCGKPSCRWSRRRRWASGWSSPPTTWSAASTT